MRVTIYQPQYFPRLHYFNRIFSADAFVVLESAQYVKSLVHEVDGGRERHKSYQSDAPIKTCNGEYFLTVSVKHEGFLPINKTCMDYQHKWQLRHIANIKANYSNAKMFTRYFSDIQTILKKQYETLADLNLATILWGIAAVLELELTTDELSFENINKALGQEDVRLKRVVGDADLGVQRPEGLQKGTEWTTSICEAIGATEYLHGGTAQSGYMDFDYYKKHGITPIVQDWKCPVYAQQYVKKGFNYNLSILDLLFNEEPEKVREVLGVAYGN